VRSVASGRPTCCIFSSCPIEGHAPPTRTEHGRQCRLATRCAATH
jgi:hypothetical protein